MQVWVKVTSRVREAGERRGNREIRRSGARTHEGGEAVRRRSSGTVLVVVIRAIRKAEGDGTYKYSEREKNCVDGVSWNASLFHEKEEGRRNLPP